MAPYGKKQGYVACSRCHYHWNFRYHTKCWQCGGGLQPAAGSGYLRPKGVWAQGSNRPKPPWWKEP
eukprot:6782350-Pyramimonas_sp.AAC.1